MRGELTLLREARPHAAGPTAELARQTRRMLMTDIATQPSRRHRRGPLVAAAAAAAAAALVGISVSGHGGGETAWAAEAVRVAEAAPRLLVATSGWSVVRADEFSVDYGEMTFANAGRQLELKWQRGAQELTKLDHPASGADFVATVRVAGGRARVFRYEDTNDFTALWLRGDYTLVARGLAANVGWFAQLLETLHEVDVDTWLSAMPESVVQPGNRGEVVRQMLEGIPLPVGFDRDRLTVGEAVRDRYQLGARVAGAVACAWIDQWVAARRTGDNSAERKAVDAMTTSRGWTVLREMDEEGDYPEVLWEYANAMAAGAEVRGGKSLTIEQTYEDALGCQAR